MPKKKKKKKSKEIAPHIKAFALKQKLDIKLYNTNIVTYQCDRHEHKNQFGKEFEPKSVIMCVTNSIGDEMNLENAIEDLAGTEVHDYIIDGIELVNITKGDSQIDKYLDGDF